MGYLSMVFETKGIRGVNNVADPARVLPSGKGSFLTQGQNIDIDNELMAYRRDGFGAPSYEGDRIHSLWGNGKTCLFVEGPDLKTLRADYSAAVLRQGVGPARMHYVDVNGIVYYTNDTVIGFVKEGADNSFRDPNQTYKTAMVPGHLIEYFNARLYVARKNQIWFSDPVALGRTDMRRNFKQLPSTVTLLGAVDDGIYVADLEATYFMAGGDPGKTVLMKKADYGAIPGTRITAMADYIAGYRGAGRVCLWASAKGLCLGGNEGAFVNLTRDYYHIAGPSEGAAILRDKGKYKQLLLTAWS
jgi:hypothetical protein